MESCFLSTLHHCLGPYYYCPRPAGGTKMLRFGSWQGCNLEIPGLPKRKGQLTFEDFQPPQELSFASSLLPYVLFFFNFLASSFCCTLSTATSSIAQDSRTIAGTFIKIDNATFHKAVGLVAGGMCSGSFSRYRGGDDQTHTCMFIPVYSVEDYANKEGAASNAHLESCSFRALGRLLFTPLTLEAAISRF